MAITHVALYDKTTGYLLALFARSASDDAASLATNGYLTVDSVVVADGVDVAAVGALAIDGPTANDAGAPPFTMEVDDVVTPTDILYLTTVGVRDPVYFGDTDSEGLVPMAP